MKRHCLAVAMLLCSVLFMACEKENLSTEDLATYGVSYQVVASNPSIILGSSPAAFDNHSLRTAGAVSWTGGSAIAHRIRFKATGDTDIDLRTSVSVPINLLGPATTLGALPIPAGSYEDALFTIELSHTDPLQLTGDYNGTPLALVLPGPIDFELRRDTLTVAPRTNYTALTTLNLSMLFHGVSAALMAEATVSNGQILIAPNSNQRIYDVIAANLKEVGELDFAAR